MITKEDLGDFEYAAHYNARPDFGHGHRCIKYPRLSLIDWGRKKTRTMEREWYVDGQKVSDLDAAIAALNVHPVLTEDEWSLLDRIPTEFVNLRKLEAELSGTTGHVTPKLAVEEHRVFLLMHMLKNKGMLEYGKSPERSDGKPWDSSIPEHMRFSPTVRRRP